MNHSNDHAKGPAMSTNTSAARQTNPAANAAPPGLAAITLQLTERRAELQAEISRKRGEIRGGHVGFDASTSTDGGDGAQLNATGSVHHAEIERDTAELNDIASAIGRITAGTYGVCTDCGERIAEARLAVWPTAKRCTPCQRQIERARSKTASL